MGIGKLRESRGTRRCLLYFVRDYGLSVAGNTGIHSLYNILNVELFRTMQQHAMIFAVEVLSWLVIGFQILILKFRIFHFVRESRTFND